MTVSSGFFNSVNHDRLYNAEQLSSIFDGIILDGVYENYGEAFKITANSDVENSVIVGTGRAWFDHTWTLNDSQYSITLDPPNEMLGRIDSIVIDVDRRENVRNNAIKYVKGGNSSNPEPPTLIKEELHKQYPLANIRFYPGSSGIISQSNITNKIGSEDCPIVSGVLESINVDMFYSQLNSEFNEWWDGIKDIIGENPVLDLQNQLDELKETVENLSDNSIKYSLFDLQNKVKPVNALNFKVLKDNGVHFFLPDGCYATIGAYDSEGKSPLYTDIKAIRLIIYSRSGVIVKTETIDSGYRYSADNDVGTSGSYLLCPCNMNVDSFPVCVTVSYASKGTVDDGITLTTRTITISEDYVVSTTSSSLNCPKDTSHSDINNSGNHSLPPIVPRIPARFSDNSYGLVVAINGLTSGYYPNTVKGSLYAGFKVLSDGTISNKSERCILFNDRTTNSSFSYQERVGEYICYTDLDDSYVYATLGGGTSEPYIGRAFSTTNFSIVTSSTSSEQTDVEESFWEKDITNIRRYSTKPKAIPLNLFKYGVLTGESYSFIEYDLPDIVNNISNRYFYNENTDQNNSSVYEGFKGGLFFMDPEHKWYIHGNNVKTMTLFNIYNYENTIRIKSRAIANVGNGYTSQESSDKSAITSSGSLYSTNLDILEDSISSNLASLLDISSCAYDGLTYASDDGKYFGIIPVSNFSAYGPEYSSTLKAPFNSKVNSNSYGLGTKPILWEVI